MSHQPVDAKATQPLNPSPCKNCGYDLQGLSYTYQCPECGLAYDPHAVVIALRGKRLRWRDAYALLALSGLVWLLAMLTLGGPQRRDRVLDDLSLPLGLGRVIEGLIYATIGVYVVVRIWRRLGSKQQLRINHRGVQFIDPSLPQRVIPWEQIDRIELSEDKSELIVRGSMRSGALTCPSSLIGPISLVVECANQINTLRDVYVKRR